MSNTIDSPCSDIKMDISSQESGISITSPEEGQNSMETNIQEDVKDETEKENEINEQMNTLSMGVKEEPQIHWHPLMPVSPSESDNSPYFNYPDVIPASEISNRPLRLTNTENNQRENENISNGNVSTKPISTTTTTNTTITATKSPKSKLKLDALKAGNHKLKKKISVLSNPGKDFNDSASDSEDLSQYQATVGPSYNSVALISNPQVNVKHSVSPNLGLSRRRKISLSVDLMAGDSDAEGSGSNHSDTPNLVSLSPSSSIFDDLGYNFNENGDDAEAIPQYTARDEARDSRNWQKITLPDGKTREIDMKVIEPYKRILSHGGYLNSGGNNAIILFSSCHLPCKSRADYHYVMDNLFYYVLKTLEQLVTDDYILIYLHGGSSRTNVPPFPWLKKCYQLLDRRLRKSLKNLYMVHPTFWLKSLVFMSRPFISSKFWRKLVYVRTLEELYQLVPVIEKTAVPEKVKNYDSRHT